MEGCKKVVRGIGCRRGSNFFRVTRSLVIFCYGQVAGVIKISDVVGIGGSITCTRDVGLCKPGGLFDAIIKYAWLQQAHSCLDKCSTIMHRIQHNLNIMGSCHE